MKKILILMLAALMMVSLCSCGFLGDVVDSNLNVVVKDKTFDFDGISIELTTDFLQMDFLSDEYDFVVGDETLTVMGFKAPFENEAVESLTVQEYAEVFASVLEEDGVSEISEVTDIDGIPTFTYRVTDEADDITYAEAFYKADDCFWILSFGVDTADFDSVYTSICEYAKSVTVE